METTGMQLLPATTLSDVTTGFSGVVGANIGPVIGVFALFLGIAWVTKRLNKAKSGRI